MTDFANSKLKLKYGALRGFGLTLLASIICVDFSAAASLTFEKTQSFFEENVSWSGRLHPQYDHLESRLKINGVEETTVASRDYLRRLFGGVKIKLSDQVTFNYLTDYSDRVTKNQILRLEIAESQFGKLHFGYQKVPFGNEDTTSSSKIKAVERSANTRFWNEVVGIGSYHTGVFQHLKFKNGVKSILSVTNSTKSDFDWPGVLDDEFALFARVTKEGNVGSGVNYRNGIDVAWNTESEDIALSAFSEMSIGEFDLAIESTIGRIETKEIERVTAVGWHGQVSRVFLEKFEWVARVSQVDTGGYRYKLSSAIRKAPYSGYDYEEVKSLYLGANIYIKSNDIKLSFGYELGNGRDPIGEAEVTESISGYRIRGQLMF